MNKKSFTLGHVLTLAACFCFSALPSFADATQNDDTTTKSTVVKSVKKTAKKKTKKHIRKLIKTEHVQAQINALQWRTDQLAGNQDGVLKTTQGDRVIFSGGVNVQAYTSNKLSPTSFTAPHNESLDLNVAYLNFHALLMPWMRAFFALTYEPGQPSISTGGTSSALEVEQAYMQFAKEQDAKIHFDLGKQYLPFSSYKRYPVVNSLTQSLSEINKVAAVLGGNYGPFFGSVYMFGSQGTLHGFGSTARDQLGSGGVEVGALKVSDQFGYEASVGYMNNMGETRYIYGIIKSMNKRVGAIAAHLSFNFGRLGFVTNGVWADNNFSSTDITFNGLGAKPHAYETEVNYFIPVSDMSSQIAFAYERSEQALFLSLPLYRYMLSYSIEFNKYLSGVLELFTAKNYRSSDTGTYRTSATTVATITGNNAWNDTAIFELAAHF